MKRSVGALGILGLVCAVALPAANAAVLYQDDFSSGKVKGVNGVYIQGSNTALQADPTSTAVGVANFVVDLNKDDQQYTWLDAGNGDGTTANAETDPTYEGLLLTGDPTWADVSIQAKMSS